MSDRSHILLVPFAPFGEYLSEIAPQPYPKVYFQVTLDLSVLAARLVLEKDDVVLTFFAQIEQVHKDIST